jgi:hypothetical protein
MLDSSEKNKNTGPWNSISRPWDFISAGPWDSSSGPWDFIFREFDQNGNYIKNSLDVDKAYRDLPLTENVSRRQTSIIPKTFFFPP